ncbi:hypothetical protein DIPPA_51426, partial [Diplonema papillatum]
MDSFQRLLGIFDPEDSATAVIRKRAVVSICMANIVGFAFAVLGETTAKMRYIYFLPLGAGLLFLAILLVTRRASSAFVSCYLLSYALIAVVLDWGLAALAEHRAWPSIMILLDVNLLASGPEWVSFVLLGVTLMWLLI